MLLLSVKWHFDHIKSILSVKFDSCNW